jgi:hypothetical protein
VAQAFSETAVFEAVLLDEPEEAAEILAGFHRGELADFIRVCQRAEALAHDALRKGA